MAIQSWVTLVVALLVFLLTLQLLGVGTFTRSDETLRKIFGAGNSSAIIRKEPSAYATSRIHLPLYAAKRYSTQQCDIFEGAWVRDHTYPLYQPGSCPYVEESFSCRENGRPDLDYIKWRWKPADCEIPRFNATDMLQRLRGKRLVFVGDSLSRNQWESMLCLLREGVADKSRVFVVNGERITKDKGAFVVQFLDYNCQVEYYGSHFLMAEEPDGESRFTLRLDMVDRSYTKWKNVSVLVFTTGHWWNRGKTAKGRNFYREGDAIYTKLNLVVAFGKAMKTWATWVDKFVNPEKTRVFMSGYSPAHFRGGHWNSGGGCQEEKEPIFNESHLPKIPEKMQVLERTLSIMDSPAKLLNVSRLSSFRKDAHPSVYGLHRVPEGASSVQVYQDCSHWCLPGVPDVWNELLYALLVMDDAH